jgi:hypothetical protein
MRLNIDGLESRWVLIAVSSYFSTGYLITRDEVCLMRFNMDGLERRRVWIAISFYFKQNGNGLLPKVGRYERDEVWSVL